jgi:phenylacetate-CoA ligase
MVNNLAHYLTRRTPDFLRQGMRLIPIQYRLGGKVFSDTYKFLLKSEFWTPEQNIYYQREKLKDLMHHLQKNVPFYKNNLFDYQDLFETLRTLPVVSKEEMQKDLPQFVSDDFSKVNTYSITTGGTSGNQLKFYLDNSTYGTEWAFVATAWKRAGYAPGDRLVSFRGVEFRNADKGVYWQDNPVYNTLEMSPFHISPDTLPAYVSMIKKVKPKFIHGYPSAISFLAKYLEDAGISIYGIKAVFAVSENVYPDQRAIIERVFNTRFFSFYGMSEKVIMAPECETDTRYHAFPQYGITEILDRNGDPVGEGECGELVGTGFMNRCMPFVRYRTGDFATYSEEPCSCGRHHLVLNDVKGRWDADVVIGKNGARIPAAAMNFHSEIFKDIDKFQYYQMNEGQVKLKIVLKTGVPALDENKLIQQIQTKTGDNLDITVEYVDDIQLSPKGKYKMIIQEKKGK